jgi:hypothetical protein
MSNYVAQVKYFNRNTSTYHTDPLLELSKTGIITHKNENFYLPNVQKEESVFTGEVRSC